MRKKYIDGEDILTYCNKRADEYIEQENYDYSLEYEFRSNVDVEASTLSQIIFSRLLSSNDCIVSYNFSSSILINKTKISFDVMNNPNASSKDYYRLGSVAKKKNTSNLKQWKNVKYYIGNFAPIPNVNGTCKKRHLQLLHRDKNERWDYLLAYCQNHWDAYSCELFPSFKDYLYKTVQYIYTRDILEDLRSKLGKREIESVENEELSSWMNDWKNMLFDKNNECEIISFGKKSTDMANVEEIIDLICLLIKLRSRMIIILLKHKKI